MIEKHNEECKKINNICDDRDDQKFCINFLHKLGNCFIVWYIANFIAAFFFNPKKNVTIYTQWDENLRNKLLG